MSAVALSCTTPIFASVIAELLSRKTHTQISFWASDPNRTTTARSFRDRKAEKLNIPKSYKLVRRFKTSDHFTSCRTKLMTDDVIRCVTSDLELLLILNDQIRP